MRLARMSAVILSLMFLLQAVQLSQAEQNGGAAIVDSTLIIEGDGEVGSGSIWVNLSIGMSTPPFGLNIFVANSLLEKNIQTIFAGLMPFIGLQIVGLIIVTFVPSLSLILANLL